METDELSIRELNELVRTWNEKMKLEDEKIKENLSRMRDSINKTKTYKKKYLPLKSVLISKG